MVLDVVGYARLMSADESGTHFRLKAHRSERIEPIVKRRRGRLIKLTGDGAMIEFPSAVEALSAAIGIQQAMLDVNRGQPADTAIVFRIGLDFGDFIVDDNELYGDGVNIAVRLEGAAPAGGIVISRNMRDAVSGRIKASFEDLGGLALKNIGRPIRAFRVEWSAADWSGEAGKGASPSVVAGSATSAAALTLPPALPDKPSIAILPFTNMSADPEQEYFTDGITEDIITEMSRFHEIFVIARNSTFTYKGRSVDVRVVATELGVRYVLEGSIRKAADRVRVTGQLIDALSGSHIWAERYDRVLKDIFAVQEELTRSIVRAIAPHILDADTEKIHRRRPEDLNAYEIAVRASAKAWDAWFKSDSGLRDAAIADAAAALAIDPRSTTALWALAFAQWQHLAFATAVDRAAAWREGRAGDRDRSLVQLRSQHEGTPAGFLRRSRSHRRGPGLRSAELRAQPPLDGGADGSLLYRDRIGRAGKCHRASSGSAPPQSARPAKADGAVEPRDGERLCASLRRWRQLRHTRYPRGARPRDAVRPSCRELCRAGRDRQGAGRVG
jgi:adenylate cyclase